VEIFHTDSHTRYETEKGWIEIENNPTENDGFHYIFSPNPIPASQQATLMPELLEELGITLDGTEFYNQDWPGSDPTNPWYIQKFDGVYVYSNQIEIINDGIHSSISFNNWNNNLSEFDLIPYTDVEQKARDYIFTIDELTGPNCDIHFIEPELYMDWETSTSLVILDGKPMWKIIAGECQNTEGFPMIAHEQYSVYVDALSGEILDYKQSRILM